jgi:hypothetical protein
LHLRDIVRSDSRLPRMESLFRDLAAHRDNFREGEEASAFASAPMSTDVTQPRQACALQPLSRRLHKFL